MPRFRYIALLIGLFTFINWSSSLLIGILIGAEDHCLRILGLHDNPIICMNSLQAIIYGAVSFILGLIIVPLLCFANKAKLRQWQIRMWLTIAVVALPFLVLAILLAVKDSVNDATQLIVPMSIAIALTSLLLTRLISSHHINSSEPANSIRPENNADKTRHRKNYWHYFFAVLLLLGFLSLLAFTAERAVPEFFAIDACLDSGGHWHYGNKECE